MIPKAVGKSTHPFVNLHLHERGWCSSDLLKVMCLFTCYIIEILK